MNYYQPGMGYQENWLPYFQKKIGNEVEIIASDRYFPFGDYDGMKFFLGERIFKPGVICENGIKITRIKTLFESVKHACVIFNGKDFLNILKNSDFDAVHLHTQSNLNIVFLLWYKKTSKKKFKIFIDCHSNPLNSPFIPRLEKSGFIYKIILHIYHKLIVKNTELFLPIDEDSAGYLKKYLKIPENMIKTLPLGTNDILFKREEAARKELRDKYKIGEEDILIIATGSFSYKKRSGILFKALREIFNDFGNLKILLVGAIESDLGRDFADVASSDKFIFFPFVKNSELYKYYSMADLSVWPSLSISIMDAMGCSLPIVVYNQKGLTCMISEKERNGFVFENEKDLCDILKKIAKNPAMAKKMGERSRAIIEEKYSWDKVARDSIELYKK